jgi:3'-5' exoribonuclease
VRACFITDLKDGQSVAAVFLIRSKEVRTSSKSTKQWLQFELADRTGCISAKMWDNFNETAEKFNRDDFVDIRGRVRVFNDQIEISLDQVLPAPDGHYDIADFLPHTKKDVAQMYARLQSYASSAKNPFLRQLLVGIVEDPALVPGLKSAPAAVKMHHAFVGGLLEHMNSLLDLMEAVAAHYRELDRDLLLTGIILHDIGKVKELTYTRAFTYTTEGQLLGHIAIGQSIVRRKIESIPDFPEPLAVLVEHLILSHHGELEFGSPCVPRFPEAIALHFLDDLDSKMGAMRSTLDGSSREEWTDRNPALRRTLLRIDRFLDDRPAGNRAAAEATSTTSGAPAASSNGANANAGQNGGNAVNAASGRGPATLFDTPNTNEPVTDEPITNEQAVRKQ